MTTTAPRIVVMGVSASGKTVVGERLAALLGLPFVDADDLHTPSARAKMHAGTPLDDDDRMPWLARVGATLSGATGGIVVACSALKRRYRDAIRADAADTVFVELTGSHELLTERAEERKGHFFPPELLDSQLAALEELGPDERGIVLDIAPSVDEIAQRAASALTPRSLVEQLGGERRVHDLALAWHRRVLADEVVSHAFSHGDHEHHVDRLAAYFVEDLGGPPRFTEAGMGDETAVVRIHSGNGEHTEMDARALDCFVAALDDLGVEGTLRDDLAGWFAARIADMARYPRSADDVPAGLRLRP